MADEKHNIQIERFIHKEMSESELRAFEQEVQSNESLAAELASQLAVRNTLRNKRKEELQVITDQRARIRKRTKVIVVAAFLSLFAIILLFWQHLTPEPNLTPDETQREIAQWIKSESPNLKTAGNNLRQLILNKEFSEVLPKLDQLMDETAAACGEIEYRYYAGVIHLLYDANYQKAEQYLACAMDSPALNNSQTAIVRYYLMTLILSGKQAEAKALMIDEGISLEDLPQSLVRQLN